MSIQGPLKDERSEGRYGQREGRGGCWCCSLPVLVGNLAVLTV